jgi:2-hydroxychromene-2-carboxylate isomerase
MRKSIRPYLVRRRLSPKRLIKKRAKFERSRQRRNLPHLVTVYLRINDAYSYLLLQVLDHLQQRYPVEFDFRTVLNLQSDMYPAPMLWQKNAFSDCVHLSDLYREVADLDIEFCSQQPTSSPQREAQLTAQLLHWELQPGYLQNALKLFRSYWQGNDAAVDALLNPSVTNHVECYRHHLSANENRLKANGHYLSGMLHYGGEWYWGVDRLQYLERRLNELGISRNGQDRVVFDRAHKKFCNRMNRQQVDQAREGRDDTQLNDRLEMFFSTRSPYSYLGLIRARQLAEHYNLPLTVKPVLPMVMRRMQVPKAKGAYIIFDVNREAQQHGIPFGFIADPLGKGVENCYSLYEFAKSEGKGLEFLESTARGVWSEAIRADTHQGLEKMVRRAGLDWQNAKPHLGDESWRHWVQENLAELYSNDQWGVPCFKFRELTVFGQDRLDHIEKAIVDAISSPDV